MQPFIDCHFLDTVTVHTYMHSSPSTCVDPHNNLEATTDHARKVQSVRETLGSKRGYIAFCCQRCWPGCPENFLCENKTAWSASCLLPRDVTWMLDFVHAFLCLLHGFWQRCLRRFAPKYRGEEINWVLIKQCRQSLYLYQEVLNIGALCTEPAYSPVWGKIFYVASM